jgi:ATP-dependent Clp protease ATP-binding subunit ClpC
MFERFTDRARQAVVVAQEEARLLDHNYIGTEHVLLGLLAQPESIAGRVLTQLGITLLATRADVEALVGRGEHTPSGHIPFTPRSKKVLELSLREALGFGHNYIGTEHILLGLVREGSGVAMQVLEARGATGSNIRTLVDAALTQSEATTAAAGAVIAVDERRTVGADAVIAVARQLAGSGSMGSHHLLEAMALVDDSLAASALAALGVAPDALAAKIDELGTAGTTDVSAEEVGVQHMELRVTDDEVTIVLRDDTSRQLGQALREVAGDSIAGTGGSAGPLIGLWQATVAGLRDLVERVKPDAAEEEQEPASRAAIVRAALRNRLRRRSGGG